MVILVNLLVSLAIIFLGYSSYKARSSALENKLFLYLCIAIGTWSFVASSEELTSIQYHELAVKTDFALAPLIGLFFFLFLREYRSGRGSIQIKTAVLTSIPPLALTILTYSGLVVKYTDTLVQQPLFILYALTMIGYVGAGIISAQKNYRTLKKHDKKKVRVFFSGLTVSAVFSILFTLILPRFSDYPGLYRIGIWSILIFVISTAFSMAVYKLFDVRVVIKRTLVFSFLLSGIFIAYAVIANLVARLVTKDFAPAQTLSIDNLTQNVIVAFAISLGFGPVRKWFEEKTDKFLFKKEYEQQTVLKALSTKLNEVVDLDEALEAIMRQLTDVFHLNHAVTFFFQPGEEGHLVIKRIKHIGHHSPKKLFLDNDDSIIHYFRDNNSVLLIDGFTRDLESEESLINKKYRAPFITGDYIRDHAVKASILKKLVRLDASAVIPLKIENQLVGLILLSNKKSDDLFSNEDYVLMELVAEQAISAIQKAKLWEGDQMKTEFVSIASHELLTPISAIEGYLSMILDENLGEVDDEARKYLTNVYSSAKRLSALIKDLLSVSRIESGKMKFASQQLDVVKLVAEAQAQLLFTAKGKGLTVDVAPAKNIPLVWADQDRAMQVIVNLLSNAIKYTPDGSIKVHVEHESRSGFVSISVKDTGLGMTHEQMSHLFQKFYRIATPDTTNIQGTGLGLYITKTIVEKMGGKIKVSSTAGKGSTFTFTLPIFKVEDATPLTQESAA